MADEDKNSRLDDILRQFDSDWTASEDARTEARNDLFFSRVSHWDDWAQPVHHAAVSRTV